MRLMSSCIMLMGLRSLHSFASISTTAAVPGSSMALKGKESKIIPGSKTIVSIFRFF